MAHRKYNTPTIGTLFGYWRFIKEVSGEERTWRCLCTGCNIVFDRNAGSIRNGRSIACQPCAAKRPRPNRKSKCSVIKDRTLRNLWRAKHKGMMNRCYDKKNKSYHAYGGRGIFVHKSFHDSDKFVKYIITLKGFDQRDLSLDRINNNKGYVRGNLRFVDKKTQANNRRPRNLWKKSEARA